MVAARSSVHLLRASIACRFPAREYVESVLAGLITLALVGMLQSLGALADTVSVDPVWRGEAAGEDERGDAGGRGASSPDAAGATAIDLPHRGEPMRGAAVSSVAPASRLRLRSPEPRAPPVLSAHASV